MGPEAELRDALGPRGWEGQEPPPLEGAALRLTLAHLWKL